jgi:ATP adenylyltransferase
VTFSELRAFIDKRMRMSHIYQPVMLITLLRGHGVCTDQKIAKSILPFDESQIDYYKNITNNMVGRVLRRHCVVEKDGHTYRLVGYESFKPAQVDELVELCLQKLDTFLEKRGEMAFYHRKASSGYISGTLRYEVLKGAKFHCELCGVAADIRALEVDHILPRNKDGTDDPANLQALCYSCNAMKRDRDATDFRAIRDSIAHREEGCPFCHLAQNRVVEQNEMAVAFRDLYPATALHTLVIPKRHVTDYFKMSQFEVKACDLLLRSQKEQLQRDDRKIVGFNIGRNAGAVAGQTVFHSHIHLIPRRAGDVEKPRGGVRNVIPGKGSY